MALGVNQECGEICSNIARSQPSRRAEKFKRRSARLIGKETLTS